MDTDSKTHRRRGGKSDAFEEDDARQRVFHFSLSRFQFLGSVVPEDSEFSLVFVTTTLLVRNVEREQSVVASQPRSPQGKVAIAANPNLRRALNNFGIHVVPDTKGQNRFATVDYKPWWRVISTEFSADVMEVLHVKVTV